jgi:hypothetical protein
MGPHLPSTSFTLKTVTAKHETVITTSTHNAAKAGKPEIMHFGNYFGSCKSSFDN